MHHTMQFFQYAHLPPHLQDISRPFGEIAKQLDDWMPDNPQKDAAMQHLLEAKDAAVRARLFKEPPLPRLDLDPDGPSRP